MSLSNDDKLNIVPYHWSHTSKSLDSIATSKRNIVRKEKAIKDFDPAFPVYDNHGIFVFYACEDCEAEQRKKYDPVIFNDYEAYEEKARAYGERIEPE